MTSDAITAAIERRIAAADTRYGPFASTHEASGVALEEWTELQQAIHSNNLAHISHECLDLAAVLIRLARSIENEDARLVSRSGK